MSWKALTWASDQTCRTSAEKFVLIMLANHADEQYTCYPSVEKLAGETQLGASTVRRCITNLSVDGKIRVLQRWGARGSRRSNRYQLLLQGADTPQPEQGDWQREYEYAPRPDGIDDGDCPDDPEGIPLGASGLSDQGVHTARCEQTAQSERFIPPGSSGYSLLEVFNPQQEPPLPPRPRNRPSRPPRSVNSGRRGTILTTKPRSGSTAASTLPVAAGLAGRSGG